MLSLVKDLLANLPFKELIFAFDVYAFGVMLKKILIKNSIDEILPYIFFKDGIQSLSVYDIFHVNFCKWYKVVVQFHLSACVYPVCPETFVQATVLFPVNILGSFVKC